MKIIILCGGIGYRLKEETEFKPKPMVFVGDKPILWHIMKIYSYFGFNDFIIALGYKGDYIKDYFLNQKYFFHDFTLYTKSGRTKIYKDSDDGKVIEDFKITFVDTGQETQPGERILRVKEFIPKEDENFMVTYGDGLGDIDIKKLLALHKKNKTIGTITAVFPKSKYGWIKEGKDRIASKFVEKPIMSQRVNGGFMIFNKKLFDYLKPGETEHPALIRLTKDKQLSIFEHNGFWLGMDTYKELEELNSLWNQKNPPWRIWK